MRCVNTADFTPAISGNILTFWKLRDDKYVSGGVVFFKEAASAL